jgi:hypothetical protein
MINLLINERAYGPNGIVETEFSCVERVEKHRQKRKRYGERYDEEYFIYLFFLISPHQRTSE